ncbi:hypothetical protein CYMTET_50711 [Cymbomonas tetramitiformis]|uniref:Uncharacterized protein n=1 Tax=Cymbomonas tetramitiformis TaxID=36881 RepID=A0AAE0ETE9_9CHLO|nr:hypothetical protein CYMTET_50711 [Cymbomonas tetramitiformis]
MKAEGMQVGDVQGGEGEAREVDMRQLELWTYSPTSNPHKLNMQVSDVAPQTELAEMTQVSLEGPETVSTLYVSTAAWLSPMTRKHVALAFPAKYSCAASPSPATPICPMWNVGGGGEGGVGRGGGIRGVGGGAVEGAHGGGFGGVDGVGVGVEERGKACTVPLTRHVSAAVACRYSMMMALPAVPLLALSEMVGGGGLGGVVPPVSLLRTAETTTSAYGTPAAAAMWAMKEVATVEFENKEELRAENVIVDLTASTEIWPGGGGGDKEVGEAVGDMVGESVVGEIDVGNWVVGWVEGEAVVGEADVGESVSGDLVGSTLGELVGEVVGEAEGEVVGGGGEAVGKVGGGWVGEAVGEVVGGAVGEVVGGVVGEVVGVEVGACVVQSHILLQRPSAAAVEASFVLYRIPPFSRMKQPYGRFVFQIGVASALPSPTPKEFAAAAQLG